ncbi:hypothetical protein [Sphingomonas mesophila]|uniref:hypothetical protein n=1 Tax=Sphingomonas mesophila TaxID=2303576 RepID=UPI000E5829AB|nr:hypothetical protein [Sphingomonas mesophila]
MSYRQHSFDPGAYDQPGPVLRPYNWVQWSGIALMAVGAAIILVEWAGKLGWLPRWVEDTGFAPISLILIGSVLVSSRRAPGTPITDEQRAKNRRTLVITALVCAAVLGAATVIEFQGA